MARDWSYENRRFELANKKSYPVIKCAGCGGDTEECLKRSTNSYVLRCVDCSLVQSADYVQNKSSEEYARRRIARQEIEAETAGHWEYAPTDHPGKLPKRWVYDR